MGETHVLDLAQILKSRKNAYTVADCDYSFEYGDADSFLSELSEIYSYTELAQFQDNFLVYNVWYESRFGEQSSDWWSLPLSKREGIALCLLEELELSCPKARLNALKSILYLLQGAFSGLTGNDDSERTLPLVDTLIPLIVRNCFLFSQRGLYGSLCTLLCLECQPSPEWQTLPANMNGSLTLRVLLSSLIILVETIRRKDLLVSSSDDNGFQPDEIKKMLDLRQEFLDDLGEAPHFPMRKVLLLLWKSVLATLGTWEDLRVQKEAYRRQHGLDPYFQDTIEVTRKMCSAEPPLVPHIIDQSSSEAHMQNLGATTGDPSTGVATGFTERARPLGAQRQLACSDSGDIPDDEDDELQTTGDSSNEVNKDEESASSTNDLPAKVENKGAFSRVALNGDVSEDSPIATPARKGSDLKKPPNAVLKTLPWWPKIREKDIELFLEHERHKFFGYQLPSDGTTMAGLPEPITQSVAALRKHAYQSLSELQIERDEQLNKYIFSKNEELIPDNSPSETLYQLLLPQLPQYMIALLKILLSAAPAARAKNDTINILVDVVPADMATDVEFSVLMTYCFTSVDPFIFLNLDINRHKEVMVKAISAVLLLLLKHFKLNHVYQFEQVAQHLVFANCIPLILKFFDQNVLRYIQSKNEVEGLNFPKCLLTVPASASPEQAALVARATNLITTSQEFDTMCNKIGATDSAGTEPCGDENKEKYFLWRNLFACINLLRILNKLTKWKHWRTMMLVVFKSAPILKRALCARNIVLQLYALKLLKTQAKYLGRQWRKTNMEIMSAIYSKVRHRLNDDWAYGNEVNAKPWDFQVAEAELRACVEKFNNRRYPHIVAGTALASELGGSVNKFRDPDFQPYDVNPLSVLGSQVILSPHFKANYEKWLEQEVFKANINWDSLVNGIRV